MSLHPPAISLPGDAIRLLESSTMKQKRQVRGQSSHIPQDVLVSPNSDNKRSSLCHYVNIHVGHEDLGCSRLSIFSSVGLNPVVNHGWIAKVPANPDVKKP